MSALKKIKQANLNNAQLHELLKLVYTQRNEYVRTVCRIKEFTHGDFRSKIGIENDEIFALLHKYYTELEL